MTANEWVDLILKLILAAGGIGGITALFMVRAQKRKLVADTGKTDAETDSVLADAQAKRTTREISMIEPYERIQARMARELQDAYAEIDRLKAWCASMAAAMRAAGINVPDEPPKITPHTTDEDRSQR